MNATSCYVHMTFLRFWAMVCEILPTYRSELMFNIQSVAVVVTKQWVIEIE